MKRLGISGSSNCPDSQAWVLLACGGGETAENAALLEHAAGCPLCAARLRDLMEAVGEGGAGEAAPVPDSSGMAIHSAQERRGLAIAMARQPRLSRPTWWWGVAAMLLLGLGIAAWMATRRGPGPALQLLAEAYSSRRVMELQISGAAWAPIQKERGAGTSMKDMPPALLHGQIEIREHLDARADDAAWLHAQGRAALLLWDFGSAIHSFQTAADLGERNPEFLVDFASAYYQRAEQNHNALDYTFALEKLGQALQQQPRNPAGLFNRAIVYGKLKQYDLAIADLELYLSGAPAAGWREEARGLLQDFRGKRAALFDSGSVPEELSAELGLESAMTGGLGAYYRKPGHQLEATANAMSARHGDGWLLEATRLHATPELLGALDTLTRVATLRTHSRTDYSSLGAAMNALSEARLPPALVMWREYELLYQQVRTSKVGNCSDTSDLLQSSRRYPWFAAQVLLESSLCAAGRQDFSLAAARVDEAARLAEAHHLKATAIRIPNFRGQRLAETGFYREAVQLAVDSLSTMQSGGYQLRRAADFHLIVMLTASQLNMPHTAYGAATMMASVSRGAGTSVTEMIAECQLARFALDVGRPQVSERAYARAQSVFRELGDAADARLYWRIARTGWLEARGDLAEAYQILREARAETEGGKGTPYFDRLLVASLCRMELRAGHCREVEALAEPFWQEVRKAAAARRGPMRAYRPDVESVSRSLAAAEVQAGHPERALASWQRFLAFDRRLLGDQSDAPAPPELNRRSAVLTVVELNGRAGLWLQTSEGTKFRWAAASHAALTERVRLLRRLGSLSSVAERRVADEARRLFSELFPLGLFGKTEVYLQARSEWNALPLATFSYAAEGKDVAFSYLPFGGALPTSAPSAKQATVVAATVFDAKLAGLPPLEGEIDEEVAAVGAAFPDRVVLRGALASARAVEGAAMSTGVLHFSGHAIPWLGGIGLVVAPDADDPNEEGRAGIWTMTRPQRMRSALAVFAACNTGAFDDPGTVRPGQLPEDALLAGAGEVVATLWDVDSAATSAWMKRFYRKLGEGRAVSEAVRLASAEMRETPAWRHPRYWAGFAAYARLAPAAPVARSARGATAVH